MPERRGRFRLERSRAGSRCRPVQVGRSREGRKNRVPSHGGMLCPSTGGVKHKIAGRPFLQPPSRLPDPPGDGTLPGIPEITRGPTCWRPQGESNPRRRRERAVSWASRRWGRIPVRRAAGSIRAGRHGFWWSQAGSNRRPLQCHCSALPSELWPREGADSRTPPPACQGWTRGLDRGRAWRGIASARARGPPAGSLGNAGVPGRAPATRLVKAARLQGVRRRSMDRRPATAARRPAGRRPGETPGPHRRERPVNRPAPG